MKIGYIINKLRNEAKLTQTQFSEIFGVSLDSLILGNNNRLIEEMNKTL